MVSKNKSKSRGKALPKKTQGRVRKCAIAKKTIVLKKKAGNKSSDVLKLAKTAKAPAGKKKPAQKSGSVITLKGKGGISKKSVVKKKRGLRVLSSSKTVSEEQKAELEKLHGILSDSFVRQMLIETGGENALVIVRNFYGAHSDEELSKNLSLRISDVRATLNRLHNEGLVQYKRAKDPETGWYSYAWTLNKDRIVKWVANFAQKHNGTSEEDGIDYYFCPKCGMNSIIEFADAHENEFKCNKCMKPLEFVEEEHFAAINQMLRKE